MSAESAFSMQALRMLFCNSSKHSARSARARICRWAKRRRGAPVRRSQARADSRGRRRAGAPEGERDRDLHRWRQTIPTTPRNAIADLQRGSFGSEFETIENRGEEVVQFTALMGLYLVRLCEFTRPRSILRCAIEVLPTVEDDSSWRLLDIEVVRSPDGGDTRAR